MAPRLACPGGIRGSVRRVGRRVRADNEILGVNGTEFARGESRCRSLQNLDSEPEWNCNRGGEDAQRLLCVMTRGRSPVR